MRILIFSLSYFPRVGGAEVAVKEITDRITDIEFDVVTMCFDKSHPKFEKIGNCTIYRINSGPGYLGKILFIPLAAIFAIRRRHDVFWGIMTYMLFPVVLARFLGNRTPYVLTLQDGDPWTHVFNRFRIFPFLPLLFHGFRHANKVQTISNFLAQWATRMGYKGNTFVIPNGVDVERFLNPKSRILNPDNVVLITTSRLVEKNGVGDIIEAMKFLPENVYLKIIGAGPLESRLKHRSEILGIKSRVKFLGEVNHSDISLYLSQADIFVRPSLSEGMGNSFIEAMAAGLPIIGTPAGGIPDFLKHEETGLFCEPKNPKSIAEQVTKLINNHELRKKLIENGLRLVKEKYDWDLIAKDMRDMVFRTI